MANLLARASLGVARLTKGKDLLRCAIFQRVEGNRAKEKVALVAIKISAMNPALPWWAGER
jgi:hypothetical protein